MPIPVRAHASPDYKSWHQYCLTQSVACGARKYTHGGGVGWFGGARRGICGKHIKSQFKSPPTSSDTPTEVLSLKRSHRPEGDARIYAAHLGRLPPSRLPPLAVTIADTGPLTQSGSRQLEIFFF